MNRRILVLGAGGFIGRRVMTALAACDALVPVAAVRTSMPGNFETVQLDATDAVALQRQARGAHAIVNCVAGSAGTIEANAQAIAALDSGSTEPPHIVHFSSMAVYGHGVGVADELTPLRGDLGEYSTAKIRAEDILRSCRNLTVFRPGIVYGPGSPWWSERIAILLLARRLGDLGAAGDGICNLLYVDDAASAVCRVVAQTMQDQPAARPARVFNLAMSGPPTWNGYFAAYVRALGVESPARISGARLAAELRLIAPALKLAELSRVAAGFVARRPAIRPWLLERCRHALTLDVRRAETALGMRWTPMAQGLKLTADWFLRNR